MKLKGLDELRRLLPDGGTSKDPSPPLSPNRSHDGKGSAVRVTLDTNGRKGKAVTLISGLHHNPRTMEEIARILKQHCGAGGTVKAGAIEIQGDQRERVKAKLEDLNYVVK